MKEQAWSPEPWLPLSDRRIARRGIVIERDGGVFRVSISVADYDRAQTCVNACAGIANPEAVPGAIEALNYLLEPTYSKRTAEHKARAALRKLEESQS